MKNLQTKQYSYSKAKKRVQEIKGFYIHLLTYIFINLILSGIILFGLLHTNRPFSKIISNFGIYSTWVFWGVGIFFHWMRVFGINSFGITKKWEERKIQEFMQQEKESI